MNSRHLYCIAASAMLMATIAGCQQQTSPPVVNKATEANEVPGDLIRVVDRTGRKVTFENPPARIVSLSPSTTELLFAIGAGESIVGATRYCDYPEAAKSIPRVGGGPLDGLSREAILGLEPDLVLCKWDSHEPLIELFTRLGIAVIAVGPESLDQLFNEAAMLGKVTGHTDGAASLITKMKARRQVLVERVAAVPESERPTVFYQVWDDPLMTAGPDSFIGEMLATAGMKNIFEDTDQRFPRVSAEVVVKHNPQVILAPSDHAGQLTYEKLAGRPGWEGVRAIADRRVYVIDGDLVSRCGPRVLGALEQMIDKVYGEKAAPGGDSR